MLCSAAALFNVLKALVDVVVDSYMDDSGEVKEKKIQLRFINSMRFMASSLGSLTNNLVKDGRKLSGFEDYSEETKLPPKEAFYSNLNIRDISDQDYSYAQKVWKGFGMKNLGEYHDLYLKTDVILLSNHFKAFRSTLLRALWYQSS